MGFVVLSSAIFIYSAYAHSKDRKIINALDSSDRNGQVMTGESRKVDRSGRTQRKKKFKQDLEQYKEDDVKAALRKGKKLVTFVERQD
jgi:hypothetical protein